MARLQILELPEGGGDDRPPFMFILDGVSDDETDRIIDSHTSIDAIARAAGARAVAVFHGLTIDLPANDTTAYLRDDSPADVHCQVSVSGQPVGWNRATETQARVVQEGQRLTQERTDIARDMDRLAKRRDELAAALGMRGTHDWDDLITSADTLRRQCDAQAAELERLRAGEEPSADERALRDNGSGTGTGPPQRSASAWRPRPWQE